MQLNEAIANQIIKRTMQIIPYPINVMDDKGRIIGSDDQTRLQQKHEGAVLAINECRVVDIDEATAQNLKGVKPGINLPIIYLDKIIGVIGISGKPDQVRHYGELVKMTAELIIEQAALMSRVEWDKRHREELVLQLIQGTKLNDNQLNTLAERLELDLNQPRIAAVIKVIPEQQTPFSSDHLRQLVNALEQFDRHNLVATLSVSNNDIVVLIPISHRHHGWSKHVETKRMNQLLRQVKTFKQFSVKVALGEYFPGLAGLAHSYETAQLTMQSVANQAGELFFYHDYKLPALMSSIINEPWKAEQLRQPYAALQQYDAKGLLTRTLSEYFRQNCDTSRTCQRLHIHRNTLRYRLEKIEQLTSLSVSHLPDKLQLYLAMTLFEYN